MFRLFIRLLVINLLERPLFRRRCMLLMCNRRLQPLSNQMTMIDCDSFVARRAGLE